MHQVLYAIAFRSTLTLVTSLFLFFQKFRVSVRVTV